MTRLAGQMVRCQEVHHIGQLSRSGIQDWRSCLITDRSRKSSRIVSCTRPYCRDLVALKCVIHGLGQYRSGNPRRCLGLRVLLDRRRLGKSRCVCRSRHQVQATRRLYRCSNWALECPRQWFYALCSQQTKMEPPLKQALTDKDHWWQRCEQISRKRRPR